MPPAEHGGRLTAAGSPSNAAPNMVRVTSTLHSPTGRRRGASQKGDPRRGPPTAASSHSRTRNGLSASDQMGHTAASSGATRRATAGVGFSTGRVRPTFLGLLFRAQLSFVRALLRLVVLERLERVDVAERRMVRDEVLRSLDSEAFRKHGA